MSDAEMDMDCEIECLDEDAEIVQQYVQNTGVVIKVENSPELPYTSDLLDERPEKKKKIKKEEVDSDYDPSEEYRQRFTKRKNRPSRPLVKKESMYERTSKYDLKIRKTLDITIPDYGDPLCLPVRAHKVDEDDTKNLRNWNNLCIKQMKNMDIQLKPDVDDTAASTRSVVLRVLKNKHTDAIDTTVWSKVTVENKSGMKKSEVVQTLLPKYNEKKMLNNFSLGPKQNKPVRYYDEVILTKEFDNNEELMIAYKPKHAVSCAYKMFEKQSEICEDEIRRYLREIVVCKMCVSCYQTSWRGLRKTKNLNVKCNICNRNCVSIYNMLSHMRTHSDAEVRAHKSSISKSLAKALQYHYECRICKRKNGSIKDLRRHLNTHKGTEPFVCEIGDHIAT